MSGNNIVIDQKLNLAILFQDIRLFDHEIKQYLLVRHTRAKLQVCGNV
jgi:hypothetical protein